MIFSLDTDKLDEIKLTFSEKEYESDIADVIADFFYGMASFFVDFAIKIDCDTEQARGLKDVFLSCVGNNIDTILEHGILEPDEEEEVSEEEIDDLIEELVARGFSEAEIENIVQLVRDTGGFAAATDVLKGIAKDAGINLKDAGIEEQKLYDEMTKLYDDWLVNNCTYNENALIEAVRNNGVMLSMIYNDNEDTIEVLLEPDDEHFFSSFNETLGSIPAELFEENRDKAEAAVLTYEMIATVLFDKAYGEEANPLRADDFVHLHIQLPSFYETSNQNTVDIDAFNTVRDVIVKQTGTSPENVLTTSMLSDFDGFDSLTLVEIIMAIEEEFDVVIPDDAAQRINSIDDILDYLKNV